MCLIIVSEQGNLIPEDLIASAHVNNPDGFGLMFPVGNGKIHTHKALVTNEQECIDIYNQYVQKDRPMALHFRLTTLGETSKQMCHPFPILTYKEDGRDIMLMHNGPSLTIPMEDEAKSDTWHFANHVLRPILKENPDYVNHPDFAKMVANIAERDRITILDGDSEEFIIENFTSTDTLPEDGTIKLSNTYSLRRGKGRAYDIKSGKTTDDSNKHAYDAYAGYGYGNGWGMEDYWDQNYESSSKTNGGGDSKSYNFPALKEVFLDVLSFCEHSKIDDDEWAIVQEQIAEIVEYMEQNEMWSKEFDENRQKAKEQLKLLEDKGEEKPPFTVQQLFQEANSEDNDNQEEQNQNSQPILAQIGEKSVLNTDDKQPPVVVDSGEPLDVAQLATLDTDAWYAYINLDVDSFQDAVKTLQRDERKQNAGGK